jgi:HPt (histidine-containing phosphotransfer) domain-containing protein
VITVTPEARAQFDVLCMRFRAGLAQRAVEIELAAADPSAASRREMVNLLHRLAGAAPPYGFDAIGALARRAEQLAQAGDDGAALAAALAELRAAMDRERV